MSSDNLEEYYSETVPVLFTIYHTMHFYYVPLISNRLTFPVNESQGMINSGDVTKTKVKNSYVKIERAC